MGKLGPGLVSLRLLTAALVTCTLVFALQAVCADEPDLSALVQRLERAEQELSQTRSELAAVRQRDAEASESAPSILDPQSGAESSAAAVNSGLFATPTIDGASTPDDVPMEVEQQVAKLGATVGELGQGMQQMKEGVEKIGESLRVTTLREHSKIAVFGELRGEMLWSSARSIIPGAPLLLAPGPIAGFDQDTFDIHAKSTMLGAAFQGPKVCGCETGGLLLAALYSETVVADRYGFMPLQAFGEVKNEDARFAAGLQLDVFNPVIPNMVNFDTIWASGNAGAYRGQVRIERYYRPSCDSQWTLQMALGEALPTTIVDNRVLGPVLSEDNGLPNLDGRIAFALGQIEGEGLAARRPFEVGVSGVVGQIRSTRPASAQIEADVWGAGIDGRWKITDWYGVQGELFTGETLGTYLGGVAQTVNTLTLEGIQASGGWGEFYVYVTPCVHVHLGYGIDDPDDSDLAAAQIELNETVFGNIFWEVTKALRLGLEISHRETDYLLLPDNDGILVHTQVQWSF